MTIEATTTHNDDDCKRQLRENVLAIVHMLENPPDVDDDGTECSELGWTWDAEEETWRDEDGAECEARPMSGFDLLSARALDVEFIVNAKREFIGADVLMTFGGPNIRILTKFNQVRGDWWGDSFFASYRDNIGLDDACEELWDMGA